MRKITLIGSCHATKGLITNEALYKILKTINPEVIFEETSPYLFNEYYKQIERPTMWGDQFYQKKLTLEKQVIKDYTNDFKNVSHIPVDLDGLKESDAKPYKEASIFTQHRSLLYSTLSDENKHLITTGGFNYLNSKKHDDIVCKIDMEIRKTVKGKYLEFWNAWLELNEKRENTMLENIYEYSRQNEYNVGVFIVGSAHRKSIIKKLKKHIYDKPNLIAWNYENYKNIL